MTDSSLSLWPILCLISVPDFQCKTPVGKHLRKSYPHFWPGAFLHCLPWSIVVWGWSRECEAVYPVPRWVMNSDEAGEWPLASKTPRPAVIVKGLNYIQVKGINPSVYIRDWNTFAKAVSSRKNLCREPINHSLQNFATSFQRKHIFFTTIYPFNSEYAGLARRAGLSLTAGIHRSVPNYFSRGISLISSKTKEPAQRLTN
jgi:hypothetical protein